ncbi:hypothetical protein [Tahibacter soli]|uniref:Sel1 repeat family protein n=1 Tax=Tahibacter soli TaxID=2983605 RepID=A0A9X3YJE5_9GAMM|nr:hypothetical protein [Tahibacter soli]MDC8013461.1 hypothetical protein [Tahibacter soli]
MRLAFALLCLLAASTADACKPPRDYRREPAQRAYDAHYAQWTHDAADALVKDPDPNVAWASLVMLLQVGEGDHAATLDLPRDPTSGVGRLMRYAYCGETERCPTGITEWVESEPDNLFVLAVALHENDSYASKARRKLDGATRYDDYTVATRTLEETLLARVPAPPPVPAGYVLPACSVLAFDAVAPRPNLGNQPAVLAAAAVFLDDGKLATPLRLKIAQLLTTPNRSPLAAVAGARLGTWAAVDTDELAHYCALEARGRSFDGDVYEWIVKGGHGVDPAVRADYFATLATRNGIDALTDIAARLPQALKPKPIDEAALAKCNARLAKKE